MRVELISEFMKEKIQKLKSDMLADLKSTASEQSIKDVEVKYFGRQGLFNEIMKSLKDMSAEEKQTVGRLANETKKNWNPLYKSDMRRWSMKTYPPLPRKNGLM